MNEYDIQEELKRIEDELIASMIRNMERHRAEETKEGFEWGMAGRTVESFGRIQETKQREIQGPIWRNQFKYSCTDQRIKKTWIFRSGSTNLGIYW